MSRTYKSVGYLVESMTKPGFFLTRSDEWSDRPEELVVWNRSCPSWAKSWGGREVRCDLIVMIPDSIDPPTGLTEPELVDLVGLLPSCVTREATDA